MNVFDLPPLVVGQADSPLAGVQCDCCVGVEVATPGLVHNRPGLSQIAYRFGTHQDFKRSMLARLSTERYPALLRLAVRSDDDFSIALLDAWATSCDVLSFYLQYYANEFYLQTATERASVIELARLIGYRLRPGVAAATDLVFTLRDPPTGPETAILRTTIPLGSRTQSVPGPDETAQTFETVEALEAELAFNAIRPRQSRSVLPAADHTSTILAGINTGLRVGDGILIVGNERTGDAESSRWSFRRLVRIATDQVRQHTYVEWNGALIDPPQQEPKVFALRRRSSLFGYNAPQKSLLPQALSADETEDVEAGEDVDWAFTLDAPHVNLDTLVPELVKGGWVVLANRAVAAAPYRIEGVDEDGLAKYAVSGRSTRLKLDVDEDGLGSYAGTSYRQTTVFCHSEELPLAETPILEPVWGDTIEVATLLDGLLPGRRMVVRGRRAAVVCRASTLTLTSLDDSTAHHEVTKHTVLTVLRKPEGAVWQLRAPGGFEGYASTSDTDLVVVEAPADAELIAEPVSLSELQNSDATHSRLKLTGELSHAFDRVSTVVHANVAAATHGESQDTLLGGGRPAQPFQSFAIAESPLTHVSARTETGARSSLALRVDDILWAEVPSLYGRGAKERVFSTRITDEGQTVVQFGDGVRGARPASGQNNIVASYRVGLGQQGNVAASSLTTLLDKPLGLEAVFNPLPGAGGDDSERLAQARRNAPITTLTLGRVVSLQDYEDFALGFAGIRKALASWVWDGDARRILVSVGGPDGAAIDPDIGTTHRDLVAALKSLGDPFVRVDVMSYRAATFETSLRVKVAPEYDAIQVLSSVEAGLRVAYSFEARGFAGLIALSALVAEVHAVPGVVAVDVDEFYRSDKAVDRAEQLRAKRPGLTPGGQLKAAEVLTLNPDPLKGLVVMS
jgi:hypothetical protein